jgi:hypothetical protein
LWGQQRRSVETGTPSEYYYSVAQLINPSSVHDIAAATFDGRINRLPDTRDKLVAYHSGLLGVDNVNSGKYMRYSLPYSRNGRTPTLDERR